MQLLVQVAIRSLVVRAPMPEQGKGSNAQAAQHHKVFHATASNARERKTEG